MSYPPTTPGVVSLSYPPGQEVRYWEALFSEDKTHTTWTAKFPVPPGGMVMQVVAANQALWADADLIIGDDADDDCFLASTAVDSTPTIDGDEVEGADSLVTKSGATKRYPNGGNVIAKLTNASVGTAAAGRTTVGCLICVPSYEVVPVLS